MIEHLVMDCREDEVAGEVAMHAQAGWVLLASACIKPRVVKVTTNEVNGKTKSFTELAEMQLVFTREAVGVKPVEDQYSIKGRKLPEVV